MFSLHPSLVRYTYIATVFVFLALFYLVAIGLKNPLYSCAFGIAALFFVWYDRSEPKNARLPVSLGNDAALVIYSALLAVVIVTIRDARGFLYVEPFRNVLTGEIPLEFFRDDPHQSVYEKGEVRKLLYEYVLYLVVNAFLFLRGWRFLRNRLDWKIDFSPATALFVFILYFATVNLPPYAIDIPHWTPFLSSANEILNGRWPYLHHYSIQYGLLNAGLLALWLSAFPFTPLGLASFISVLAMAAGALIYLLMKKITRSSWFSLVAVFGLLFSAYDNTVAIHIPNLSAFRSYFLIAAALLLLWLTLSAGSRAGKNISAFFLGVLVLWDPVPGLFLAISFSTIHLYRRLAGQDSSATSAAFSFLSGLGAPLILAIVYNKSALDFLSEDTYRILFSNHRFFMEGFGNAAQKLHPSEVLVFLYLFLALALIGRRIITRRFNLNNSHLFAIGSTIISVPWVMYELGNSNTTYVNPMLWAFAPGMTLLAYTAFRYARMTKRRLPAILVLAVLASPFYHHDFFTPAFGRVKIYVTKYEEERAAWYRKCVVEIKEGRGCDLSAQPGLAFYLREAAKPGFGLGVLQDQDGGSNAGVFVNNLPDYFLTTACKRRLPILSIADGFIYLQNRCRAPHEFPTTLHVSGRGAVSGYVRALTRHPLVVYDQRRFTQYYTEAHFEHVKNLLLNEGYVEKESHGVIHVLARRDFRMDMTNCIVCSESRSVETTLNVNGRKWNTEAGFPLKKKIYAIPPGRRSYSLDVDLTIRDADGAGVMFRVNSEFEYYAFYVNVNRNLFTLGKYRLPDTRNHEDLFNAPMDSRYVSPNNRRYHVRVIADHNNNFQFFVNGIHVAEWMDPDYATGGVGLWYWGGDVEFSNLRITYHHYGLETGAEI